MSKANTAVRDLNGFKAQIIIKVRNPILPSQAFINERLKTNETVHKTWMMFLQRKIETLGRMLEGIYGRGEYTRGWRKK